MRIPPGVNAKKAQDAIKFELERDPPYNSKVIYNDVDIGSGWFGGEMKIDIKNALNIASDDIFDNDPMFIYDGASIPLCTVFQNLWNEVQILVTGTAGPETNLHSYDECLDLPYIAKFTAFLADLFAKLH